MSEEELPLVNDWDRATLGFDVAEVEPVLYKIDEYLVRQHGDRRHELVSPVMEVCPISWSFLTTGEQLIHGVALTDTETELCENSNKLVQLTVDRILEALSNKLEPVEALRYLAELYFSTF